VNGYKIFSYVGCASRTLTNVGHWNGARCAPYMATAVKA